MSKAKRTSRRERHIQVRSVRREPADLRKLASAIIALAQAQAEADAEAEAKAKSSKKDGQGRAVGGAA